LLVGEIGQRSSRKLVHVTAADLVLNHPSKCVVDGVLLRAGTKDQPGFGQQSMI
jgi:hypothetical protein